jgi:Glycerophosphoryl diester phosphodiesterase family
MGPSGHRFLRDAHAAGRAVFVWTVNDTSTMRWSIRRGVDGVLTDDPKKFLDLCSDYREDVFFEEDRLTMRQCLHIVGFHILAVVFSLLFRWRHRHEPVLRGEAHQEMEGRRKVAEIVLNGGTVRSDGDGKREDESEGSVAC